MNIRTLAIFFLALLAPLATATLSNSTIVVHKGGGGGHGGGDGGGGGHGDGDSGSESGSGTGGGTNGGKPVYGGGYHGGGNSLGVRKVTVALGAAAAAGLGTELWRF
jgi:hypothetical protein